MTLPSAETALSEAHTHTHTHTHTHSQSKHARKASTRASRECVGVKSSGEDGAVSARLTTPPPQPPPSQQNPQPYPTLPYPTPPNRSITQARQVEEARGGGRRPVAWTLPSARAS
eukprot:987983-Rhodomonas_salina.1